MPRYGNVDRAYAMDLATRAPELDGPILMVNLMRYRDVADYATEPVDGPAHTGKEADDAYAPVDVLDDLGAVVAFHGDVVAAAGGSADRWDRIGVVKYPTRQSFIGMQSRKDFQDKHVHKEAGMEFTIVMGCLPRPSGTLDPERGSLLRWEIHPQGAEPPSEGVDAVLDVEGTIMGDERRWSAVTLTWISETAGDVASAHDGGMVIVVRPEIDRLAKLVSTWHDR